MPFSIEAGGVWGPAATRFFDLCLKLADSDRNVDLYHWSSGQFSSTWYDTLSVLVAKGRAKVGVAAAAADWSRIYSIWAVHLQFGYPRSNFGPFL